VFLNGDVCVVTIVIRWGGEGRKGAMGEGERGGGGGGGELVADLMTGMGGAKETM